MQRLVSALVLCSAALTFAVAMPRTAAALPVTILGDSYDVSGPTEILIVPFINLERTTSGTYSDLVLISVSGSGTALGPDPNDAFYVFGGPFSIANRDSFYQLVINASPLVLTDTTRNARNLIVYDIDADTEVAQPYVPAYQPSHEYNFVIDVSLFGPPSSILHFGNNDGLFSDNSGSFSIEVTQLQIMPEASTGLLLATGLFGLSVGRLRLRR